MAKKGEREGRVVLEAGVGEEVRAGVTVDGDLVIEVWRREQQYVLQGGEAVVQKLTDLMARVPARKDGG